MAPDLKDIVGFEWDSGNDAKSVEKHSVYRHESEQAFANQPLIVAEDPAHSKSEQRYRALGKTNEGRLLHIVFTIRGEFVRVISARPMSRNERKIYESED